ncbi:MAG: hypothetical protein KME05_23765 [Gloeocapsa sp. UFS-A4-WI-NPMV-4B04]|nr:hypothetical protein [Gloeocapsa sp. UFS-A4-WI-NPMV-4B04]
MFSYFAYGLGIHSAIPLPEFIPVDIECDVTIRLEKSDPTPNDYVPLAAIDKPLYLKINTAEAIIAVKDLAVFVVRGGQEIVIIPTQNQNIDERLIRLYIVGTVMAVLLYQRGLLVLHGSVVDVNGAAIAFLGKSGAGKSSTAAAMHKYGYKLLADDVAAIKLDSTATVFPGFPQIKLSSEAAVSLGYDTEALSLYPVTEKHGYRLQQEFPQVPLPLKCIYVLADEPEFDIEILRPQEAVIELVRHSRPTTLFHSGGAPHFLQCANLAKKLTVYRLKRPRSLSLLPDLAKFVEEHLASTLQQVKV